MNIQPSQRFVTNWQNINTNAIQSLEIENIKNIVNIIEKNGEIILEHSRTYKFKSLSPSFKLNRSSELTMVTIFGDGLIKLDLIPYNNGKHRFTVPFIGNAKNDKYKFFLSNANNEIWESNNLHLYTSENYVKELNTVQITTTTTINSTYAPHPSATEQNNNNNNSNSFSVLPPNSSILMTRTDSTNPSTTIVPNPSSRSLSSYDMENPNSSLDLDHSKTSLSSPSIHTPVDSSSSTDEEIRNKRFKQIDANNK